LSIFSFASHPGGSARNKSSDTGSSIVYAHTLTYIWRLLDTGNHYRRFTIPACFHSLTFIIYGVFFGWFIGRRNIGSWLVGWYGMNIMTLFFIFFHWIYICSFVVYACKSCSQYTFNVNSDSTLSPSLQSPPTATSSSQDPGLGLLIPEIASPTIPTGCGSTFVHVCTYQPILLVTTRHFLRFLAHPHNTAAGHADAQIPIDIAMRNAHNGAFLKDCFFALPSSSDPKVQRKRSAGRIQHVGLCGDLQNPLFIVKGVRDQR
jgi:hypothetical protein